MIRLIPTNYIACVAGAWKRAREKETRVSPSRAPVLSFARYFQAPATQATIITDHRVSLEKGSVSEVWNKFVVSEEVGELASLLGSPSCEFL